MERKRWYQLGLKVPKSKSGDGAKKIKKLKSDVDNEVGDDDFVFHFLFFQFTFLIRHFSYSCFYFLVNHYLFGPSLLLPYFILLVSIFLYTTIFLSNF